MFTSCDQEDEINLSQFESQIVVDKQSQIVLEPTTLNKEEIEASSCDEPVEVTLYAGQHIVAGDVRISNSEEELFITYDLNNTSWALKETHLYVGPEAGIPYTNSGNPKIGHFPYHGEHDKTKEYTYSIPLDGLDDCFVIITHAVVVSGQGGSSGSSETAFGYGNNTFPGNRWGWFLDYCQQECSEDGSGTQGDNNSGENNDSGENDNGTDGNGTTANSNTDGSGGTQGNQGETGSGGGEQNPPATCMTAFAFNADAQQDTRCFLDDGFSSPGWTNLLSYDPLADYVQGDYHRVPLLANVDGCTTANSLDVGYVDVRITGGDGVFFADVTFVVTDPEYVLQEAYLYAGRDKYPDDQYGADTVNTYYFGSSVTGLNSSSHTFTQVKWYSSSYFIAQANVCPASL